MRAPTPPSPDCGKLAAVLRREFEGGQARQAQIFAQNSDRGAADHVAGTGHRERRHRHAARQCLQKDQPERVRLARKYENVGGGIGFRQCFAMQRAQEDGLRIFPLQGRARRAIADHDLGARQIKFEKCFKILFDRDPADRQKDRARQAEIDGARPEQLGIDAARPQHHVAETAPAQFAGQRRRRRHHRLAGSMEPAQRRPTPGFRNRQARRDVFRKSGMETRGERQSALAAIAAHRKPDRSFGRDMNAVRPRLRDQARYFRRTRQGNAQIGIARHCESCGTIAA